MVKSFCRPESGMSELKTGISIPSTSINEVKRILREPMLCMFLAADSRDGNDRTTRGRDGMYRANIFAVEKPHENTLELRK